MQKFGGNVAGRVLAVRPPNSPTALNPITLDRYLRVQEELIVGTGPQVSVPIPDPICKV
jgi:hypothetical protein